VDSFDEVGYEHNPYSHCPQSEKAWERGRCSCDFNKRFGTSVFGQEGLEQTLTGRRLRELLVHAEMGCGHRKRQGMRRGGRRDAIARTFKASRAAALIFHRHFVPACIDNDLDDVRTADPPHLTAPHMHWRTRYLLFAVLVCLSVRRAPSGGLPLVHMRTYSSVCSGDTTGWPMGQDRQHQTLPMRSARARTRTRRY
jgi:hypothetical protein